MNFSRALIVVRKELTDALRDRRSVYSVFIGALIGPILVGFMLNRIADQQRGAQEIKVPVVGRDHAPILVDWLEQQAGVEIIAGPADPEAAVRERKFEFVLVIPKEFPEKFRASRPAPVQLVSDALVIGAQSTGLIFIIKADDTPIPLAKRALMRIASANIPIFGVVLNQQDFKKAEKYYGEYSGYGKYWYVAGYAVKR